MHIRKLLDWRKLLIYSHRWLGIVVGLVFVAWCVSGVVLMYYGVPHLTAGERLMRLPVLDLSTVRVSPSDAAAQLKEPPRRLRISMHGDRPVYRFNTGRVFGRWTLIYADTGEPAATLDRDAALSWLKGYLPEQHTLRYDAYLQRPDTYTRLPAMQTHFPLHRVALDDGAGTEYYVSERSGEAVMKSDRRTRMLGIVRIHHAHVLLLPPEVVVERASSVDVVDRAADVHHRRGRGRVALRPVTALPSQADPVSFALHRLDEVASLRRFDLWRVHHHVGLQRPGIA